MSTSEGEKKYDIERFYSAHKEFYYIALREMKNGYKINHWIWFIFPQLRILAHSEKATYYGIENADEARQYYEDPYLGESLREITAALLSCKSDDPVQVMDYPDNLKLQASMTLFYEATGDSLFSDVLNKFYDGKRDESTLSYLNTLKQD